MQQFRAWVTGVCFALVLGMGGAVQAASLQLSSTSLSLPAGQRAGALVLRNTGRAPVTAQIRAFSWQQDAQGKDVLTPTAALIVSPPMVRLDAGAEQQFRVIRAQTAGGVNRPTACGSTNCHRRVQHRARASSFCCATRCRCS